MAKVFHMHSTYAGAPTHWEVKEKSLTIHHTLGDLGLNALFGHSIYPHPLPLPQLHGRNLGRKRKKAPLNRSKPQLCPFCPGDLWLPFYLFLPEGWVLYGNATHWHLGLDSCVSQRTGCLVILTSSSGLPWEGQKWDTSSHTDLLS